MLYSSSLLIIYFIHSSVYMLIPSSYFNIPPTSFPFGNHTFVFYVFESLSVLKISSFVSFFKDFSTRDMSILSF